MVEGLDAIDLVRDLGLLAGAEVFDQHGDLAADNVAQGHVGVGIVLGCDDDGRTGDVLEAAVLHEDAVVEAFLDLIDGRDILRLEVDDRQTGFLGVDGGLALAFEIAVGHHDLPARGGLGREDAVFTADEGDVLHLVADIEKTGLALADVDRHVADETVLGEVGAQGDCLRVAVFDADVDVGHATVEGAGSGVTDAVLVRDDTAGEPEHVFALALVVGMFVGETGGVLGKDEFRTFLAVADHADGTRDVDGAADAVFAFGNEEDTECLFRLDAVDGCLKRLGDIGLAVGGDAGEVLRGEKQGLGIIRLLGVDRLLLDGTRGKGAEQQDREQ